MADWGDARRFLKAQRVTLASRSFAELAALDEYATIQPTEDLRPFQFTVYRKLLPDGSLKVIVEAWRSRFFGILHNSAADGFVISPMGIQRELEPEDLW